MADTPIEFTPDTERFNRQLREAAERGDTGVVSDIGMVCVFRHHEVEQLLHDPRLHGVGLTYFDFMGIEDGPLRDWYGALMFTNEGPPHHRLRRLVAKAFTPRSVERLREHARLMAKDRLEDVDPGDTDLITVFGQLPMQVMCALLGVPASSVDDFSRWTDAISAVFGLMDPDEIAAATDAIEPLLACVAEIVEARSRNPTDDLISALVAAEDDGDTLTRQETVAMVVNLLAGGHDTTASQIGCTLFTLLKRPQVLQLAVDDPDLIGPIVSESIRYEPSLPGAPRTVVEPIQIGGTERSSGTSVLLTTMTANRDRLVWRDPDEFVPRRFTEEGAPRLLSFGAGVHYCLGAALARLTLEETVRAVAPRRPTLDADPADIEWVSVLGRSPKSLSVTFTA
jgi:cytochrome P450